MKRPILLIFTAILIINTVSAWIDCTPSCNEYYNQGSVICPDPNNVSACKRNCSITAGCYGDRIQMSSGSSYDSDTNDNRAETYYYFGPDGVNTDCSGTSCYTDYCYEVDMTISSTVYLEGEENSQTDVNLNCFVDEDITQFGPYEDIIDDDVSIYLDGNDEGYNEDTAIIYPYNYGSYTYDLGYFTTTSGDEDIRCNTEVGFNVDEITNNFEWATYRKDWLDADAYVSYCERINEQPALNNCQGAQINEDSTGSSISIDLWECHTDPDGSDEGSNFSINSESNIDLIDCYIDGDRYLKCTDPSANKHGFSSIVINVIDEYNNLESETIQVNVTSIPDPPNASNIQVLPLDATLADDLTCSYNFSNVGEQLDEQGSAFEWWRNGANQNINSEKLGKGNLSLGNNWYCKVTPSDGLSNGTKIQSSNTVIITNTIQNPALYVGDAESWNVSGYYSSKSIIGNMNSYINEELASCQEAADGYCIIPLTFFSNSDGVINISDIKIYYRLLEENLNITLSQGIYSSGTFQIFEFIVQNYGETQLSYVS